MPRIFIVLCTLVSFASHAQDERNVFATQGSVPIELHDTLLSYLQFEYPCLDPAMTREVYSEQSVGPTGEGLLTVQFSVQYRTRSGLYRLGSVTLISSLSLTTNFKLAQAHPAGYLLCSQ